MINDYHEEELMSVFCLVLETSAIQGHVEGRGNPQNARTNRAVKASSSALRVYFFKILTIY